MPPERKTFRHIGADQRREAMIAGVLAVIAEEGISAATTRAVAARAGVTPGLIRHYFDGKDALLGAAFAQHMAQLTAATCASGAQEPSGASARLVRFITRGLTPPVVSPEAVSLWAGFLTRVQQGGPMQEVHAAAYTDFRDHLQELIAAAFEEAGQDASPARLRRHAIACNALIDGLWLEGGVLPDAFAAGELPKIGLDGCAAILNLPLSAVSMTEGDMP